MSESEESEESQVEKQRAGGRLFSSLALSLSLSLLLIEPFTSLSLSLSLSLSSRRLSTIIYCADAEKRTLPRQNGLMNESSQKTLDKRENETHARATSKWQLYDQRHKNRVKSREKQQ